MVRESALFVPFLTLENLLDRTTPNETRGNCGIAAGSSTSYQNADLSQTTLLADVTTGHMPRGAPWQWLSHGMAHDGRPPNCQLCTSMSAYLSGAKMERASSGSGARISSAVPTQVTPLSDSSGP
jgi:hypothetical protein